MNQPPTQFDQAMQRARAARRTFPFQPAPAADAHIPVVIVGAGPVGLAAAAELARHGVQGVVLEQANTLSDGSRAVCWAKRSLEFCDRLGIAERMLAKGVTWNTGKVFYGGAPDPLYTFDLLPDKAQKFPAFVNLQQFYTEEYLVDSLPATSQVRWQHQVTGVRPGADAVALEVSTPEGAYCLSCSYLIAADGCRSHIRGLLGLDFEGRSFEDNFLIADVRMNVPFPAERRFFFNAPFNEGRTALMHQQPDGIWRLDFQLGWQIDREAALREENVTAKVRALLGPDVAFEYEWVSLYSFQCRRMKRFVHGRVIFAGDAAHLVSPFGARGANGGLQDVDNLGWKLALVINGEAPTALLESYDEERGHGADENIANSTRSTEFMTPKSPAELAFRDAALELAQRHPFARRFVNSGRLSVPCHQRRSSLTTPDTGNFQCALQPGDVCADAPITGKSGNRWLLEQFGRGFCCLYFAGDGALSATIVARQLPSRVGMLCIGVASGSGVDIIDADGDVHRRYDAAPGTTYLIRPDQHVAARWRQFDPAALSSALARAMALN